MRELIVYNADKEKRIRLSNWLCQYCRSDDYRTNVMDFSKSKFYLRFESETPIPIFKRHWLGVLEFFDLDTYDGRAIQIGGKPHPRHRGTILIDTYEEISQWFKNNIPHGDYEETLVKNGRIRFIKSLEDMNLFRLIWGEKIDIEVRDYMDEQKE